MRCFIVLSAAAVVLFVWGLTGQGQQPSSAYKILKKYEIGGEGGWDYLTLDPEARRLYISRSSHVMIMDIDTGKVVGDIPNTKGVHGIALALKHKKGFTSNGGDASSTIFDLESLKETGRVSVGKGPDFIMYDPVADRVFTFNATSKDATAIDAATGKVAGTVKLEGRAEAGVPDGKGMVYVNIMDKSELVTFDAKTLVVKSRWPLAPGATAVGLALDSAKNRLFSTCRNEKMVVMDGGTGKVLGSVPIGKGTDACVFDAKANLAFSSNSDGTLTVVEEKDGGYRVLANVETVPGAKTMAFDPKTQNIYLAAVRYKAGAGAKKAAEPNSFTILVVGK